MSQQALLKRIVEALDDAGIPYMLAGSLVSTPQGEPRATHDIDLVVDIAAGDVARVMRALALPVLTRSTRHRHGCLFEGRDRGERRPPIRCVSG